MMGTPAPLTVCKPVHVASQVGDSLAVRPQKLSATMRSIEDDRKRARVSQDALVAAAGLSRATYQRLLTRDPMSIPQEVLTRVARALRALEKKQAPPSSDADNVRWDYAGALERTARFYRVTRGAAQKSRQGRS